MSIRYPFVDIGRQIEIEAVRGGRRSNEFSVSPALSMTNAAVAFDDQSVAFRPADDILETEDRGAGLDRYVPFAREAFEQRGLEYPFQRAGDTLAVSGGQEARRLAEKVVAL